MTLANTAYVQLERGDGEVGTFEFHVGLEVTRELTKSFVMGDRGQYLREIVSADFTPTDIDVEQRRAGYWLDGGGGSRPITIPFESGLEERDLTWGDGSGGTGSANVTKWDASGSGIERVRRADILEQWLANTRTDSLLPGRLHYGEWTDGSLDDYQGKDAGYVDVDAGVFEQPRPVAVTESNLSDPLEFGDRVEGSITVQHIAPLPEGMQDWMTNTLDTLEELLGDVPDA